MALLVAFQHFGILVLEMFFWERPLGLAVFHTTPAVATVSAPLALNQGLYNGFLCAGLVWGLLAADSTTGKSRLTFFFSCVAAAGIFGGITALPQIALIQGLPAIVGLVLVRVARTSSAISTRQ
jgi:putative membrane protein